MAGESYNLDPSVLNAVQTYAQNIQNSMGSTRDSISQINAVLADITRAYSNIMQGGKNLGLDPSVLGQVTDAHRAFQAIGQAVNKAAQSTQSEDKAVQKVASSVKKTSNEAKNKNKVLDTQVKLTKQESVLADKLTKILKQQKDIKKSILDNEQKAGKDKKDVGQADEDKKDEKQKVKKRSTTLAITEQALALAGLGGILRENKDRALGFEFSITGIIKAIISLNDVGKKISGYARMSAYQFKEWGTSADIVARRTNDFERKMVYTSKSISMASRSLWDMKTRFVMGAEEAGKLNAQLTRAGFEEQDMGTYIQRANKGKKEFVATGSRMLAIETLQGRSIDTQLKSIMDLRNNFGMMVTSAQTLDALIGNIGKNIPGLSSQEAVDDILKMQKGMRLFSTDVLDSITLYHSLNNAAEDHRKKVEAAKLDAKKTGRAYQAPSLTSPWGGLVKAPLEIRKELLQYMTSSALQLQPGMKAALGKGGSTEAKLAEFYKAAENPVEIFVRQMQFLIEQTRGQANAPGTRRVSMVGLATKEFGMSQELAEFLAKDIVATNMSVESLQKLAQTYQSERQAMEKMAGDRDTLIKNLTTAGQGINYQLKSTEEVLKKWVENTLAPKVTEWVDKLVGAMNELKEAMGGTEGAKETFGFDSKQEKSFNKLEEIVSAESKKDQKNAAKRNLAAGMMFLKEAVSEQAGGAASEELSNYPTNASFLQKAGQYLGGPFAYGKIKSEHEKRLFAKLQTPGQILETLKGKDKESELMRKYLEQRFSKLPGYKPGESMTAFLEALESFVNKDQNSAVRTSNQAKSIADKAKASNVKEKTVQVPPGIVVTNPLPVVPLGTTPQ